MFTMIFKKLVIGLMICNVLVLGLTPVAKARLVTTQETLQVSERDRQLSMINDFMLHNDVQEQMIAFGVEPADVQERLAALTDEELRQLSDRMQNMPAGGDSLLAVIGIVFVVLIILELIGVTNIFSRL